MLEQFGPASGAGIPRGDRRSRQRPVDRKVRIVVGDRDVFGRVVRAVDPIAHICGGGEHLKPVQEARRDIQMPEVVVVELERLLTPERRGIPSDVDQYVVYRAVCATNQFGLAATRAAVHAADNPLHRAGLGILNEHNCPTHRTEVSVEDVRVKRPGEQAAVVTERTGDEDEHADEFSLFDKHNEMLS